MKDNKLLDKATYKLNIIKEYEINNKTISQICKEYEISRMTFYRWYNSYKKNSFEGLIEKSKRPKHIEETPKWVQDIILELYYKLNLGCRNISYTLNSLYSLSHQGILNILRRHEINIEQKKKEWKRFRAPFKNYLWQVDFLGPHSTYRRDKHFSYVR
jgi:transposase